MKKQTRTLLFIIVASLLFASNIANAQSTAATNVYNAANWLGFDNTGGGGNLDFKVNSVTWLTLQNTSGNFGVGTATPTANLHVAQKVFSTGILKGFIYTGALNTNQTLSTEIPSATFTTVGRQWATGALTTQREILITQPAYSFVGASTITDAATVGIAGAPIKSTNATITNTHGLLVQAGAVSTATNSYGLTVNAQTGATNNYAAQFMGGNVGIGTTGPGKTLDVYNSVASRIRVDGPLSTEPGFEIGSVGTTKWLLYRPANTADLRFYDGSVDAITFKAGGNVGIGTTTPSYKLDVYTNTASDVAVRAINASSAGTVYGGAFIANGSGATANVGLYASTNGSAGIDYAFEIGTLAADANNYALYSLAQAKSYFAGSVGIGLTAPSEKLEVNGNIKIPTGNAYIGSDIRLKTDIDSIENSLQLVKQLQGVYFKWDTTVMNTMGFNYNPGRQIGFIAQNVQSVLPEIVATNNDSMGLLSIDYSRFTPVLVEAVKELAKHDSLQSVKTETDSLLIDSLKQDLISANARIDSQDSIVSSLQSQINILASLINNCCNNNGNGNGNGHNNLSTSGTGDYKSMPIATTTSVELNNKNIIVLDQNAPNPFAEQTTIGYYLPDNVSKAQIVFYERSGKILKTVDLKGKGKGVLSVFANDLTSGLYIYSLIVDGQVVETKKMVKE